MQGRSDPAHNAGATEQLRRCIGDNIRQARLCQGMSLADLGHALAIAEVVVANYEAGLEKVSPMITLQDSNHARYDAGISLRHARAVVW